MKNAEGSSPHSAGVFDEVESADAETDLTDDHLAGLEVEGLAVLPGLPARRRQSSRGLIALACIGVALAAVIWRGLGSASLYFYTADQAVVQAASLDDRRFRLEGVVATEARALADCRHITFDIEEGGTTVRVRHAGDPQELFQVGIPVVLEGSFAAPGEQPRDASEPKLFESDRMIVKHTSEYVDEYPERVEPSASVLAPVASVPCTAPSR